MRNYLRPEQAKKLTKQQRRARQHRWASSSLTISLLLAASTVFMAKVVLAAYLPKQACVPSSDYMHILSDSPAAPDGSNPPATYGSISPSFIASWQNGNFFFKVFDFYIANDDTANSGDSCSVSFHIRTNTDEFKWQNQRPVDVRLGVPNMGPRVGVEGNNYGVWALPGANLGSNVSYRRPPEYSNNFRSFAAFVDDGGMATIGGSPMNPGFQTLWCQNFNPGAVFAGGQGLLAGDAGKGCPLFNGPPNNSDITNGNTPHDGTGYMFTADNCHFYNHDTGPGLIPPPVSGTDGDGSAVAPCDSEAVQTAQNSWYWNEMQALPNVTAVTQGVAFPKNRLTLKNYIGCSGGPFLCDGRKDPLNDFDLHMYSRNHILPNPYPGIDCGFIRAGGLDCATSAHTILTFAYPIKPTLMVQKTPNGKYCPKNVVFNNANCSNANAGGSYNITVWETPPPGTVNPLLDSATITDKIPPQVAWSSWANGSCMVSDPGTDGGAVLPNVEWDLSPTELTLLKLGVQLQFCYSVKTKSIFGPFTNGVNFTGTVASTGQNAFPASDTTTNFVIDSQYPYFSTTGGDVHAGGTVCSSNLSPPVPGVAPLVSLQGQSYSPLSQGDYVASATNSVLNFSGAGGILNGSGAPGVCRPDLLSAAASYTTPAATPYTGLAQLSANYGPTGALIHVTAAQVAGMGGIFTLPSVMINSRVTLWVEGPVVVTGTVSYSGAMAAQKEGLASFGLIASNNIGFESNVMVTNGFFYSYNDIATCTDATGKRYNSLPAAVDPNYGINKLKTLCTQPLVVNGLLSGYTVNFNRVGPNIPGSTPQTELFNYTGLLLLAPPPVFDLSNAGLPPSNSIKVLPPQY